MLKADIKLGDLSSAPVLRNGGLCFGQSWILPFQHPALETVLIRTEGQWFAVVRERCAAHHPMFTGWVNLDAYVQAYQACLAWPLDYIMIEVLMDARRLRIRSGVLGSAPVYCAPREDALKVSWDFADLLSGHITFDVETMAHFLALDTFYSARQACLGIYLLTERASLYVEPDWAHYEYPDPVEARPSERQTDECDLLEEFGERLQDIIALRSVEAKEIALELSGGMDSATVAAALHRYAGPVETVGIAAGGVNGQFQLARRQALISAFHLNDFLVDIEAFPPCVDLRPDVRPREHALGELYLEAFQAIWRHARVAGAALMFSGIGGDELFPLFSDEEKHRRRDADHAYAAIQERARGLLSSHGLAIAMSTRVFDAPVSAVSMSALLSQVCRAPYLLRCHFWPVNVLSDPVLRDFCWRLPLSQRSNRRMLHDYLGIRLPAGIFRANYKKETFLQKGDFRSRVAAADRPACCRNLPAAKKLRVSRFRPCGTTRRAEVISGRRKNA